MKSISAVADIYDRIAAVKSINRYEALGHLTRQRHILHFLSYDDAVGDYFKMCHTIFTDSSEK